MLLALLINCTAAYDQKNVVPYSLQMLFVQHLN